LIITIVREAVEEIRCFLRDKEVNSQIYSKLSTRGELLVLLGWFDWMILYQADSLYIHLLINFLW